MNIDIEDIIDITHEAGVAILEVYHSPDFEIKTKSDNSPVTKADMLANDIILKRLKKYNIGIISEEIKNSSYDIRKDWEYAFVVDPLDGTRGFIKHKDNFTVNIGLIKNGKPILGVVYHPINDVFYYAKSGSGAFMRSGGVDKKLPYAKGGSKLRVAGSDTHIDPDTLAYIESLGEHELVTCDSSVKFCLVATGEIDIYPRLRSIMEWDICASHVILNEAGKHVYEYGSDKELIYNKEDLHSGKFVAK